MAVNPTLAASATPGLWSARQVVGQAARRPQRPRRLLASGGHEGTRRLQGTRWLAGAALLALTWGGGCGELQGLDESLTPLVSLRLAPKGDLMSVLSPDRKSADLRLRAALVWGAVPAPRRFCLEYSPWLPVYPPAPATVTAVAKAACDDPLAFAPALVATGAVLELGETTTLSLIHLPTAEVLVGPPEGRTAYGSLVIYDDRNNTGTLDLRRARRHFAPREDRHGPGSMGGGDGPGGDGPGGGDPLGDDPLDEKNADEIYGASFVSMLKPHVRVAFREGTFGAAALFYPMLGCDPPPEGFSTIAVGGTPIKSTCAVTEPGAVVEIALEATATLAHLACEPGNDRYVEASGAQVGFAPEADLTQPWVCMSEVELVVANPPGPCRGLTAFLLKGCAKSAACEDPDWDNTGNPPKWWPCKGAETVPPGGAGNGLGSPGGPGKPGEGGKP